MSRAQFMNDQYFEEYINSQKQRIVKFSKVLESLDPTDQKKIVQCKAYLVEFNKNLLSAEYSAGRSKEQIKRTFTEYLSLLKDVPISSYADMVDALALAILYDCSESDIAAILNETKFDDALTRKMKDYILSGAYSTCKASLEYESHYQVFDEYLNGELDLKEFLKYMENGWYNSCTDFAFFDAHKNIENVYTGYWCWLAAAVLKMNAVTEVVSSYIPVELL